MKTFIQILTVIALLVIIGILGFKLKDLINERKTFETAATSDRTDNYTLNGTIGFINDYKPEYSEEELGVIAINKITRNGKESNLFGANEAQIKVSDSSGNIIGLGMADKYGKFAIELNNRDDFYHLDITFRDIQRSIDITADQNDLKIYLGYLNVANGQWSDEASLQ